MARVKGGPKTRRRHKKVLEMAKGQRGKRHASYRRAHEAMLHALKYATVHRRTKKRDFRRLWIQRINAACRLQGISYSKFMAGLKGAGVVLDRKVLSDIAARDQKAFAQLVETAKGGLAIPASA